MDITDFFTVNKIAKRNQDSYYYTIIIIVITNADSLFLYGRVKTWAHKLGFELSQLGKYVTNVEKFHDSYKQAEVTPRDGNSLVHEIAKDIKAMMESKISAIKVCAFYFICRSNG